MIRKCSDANFEVILEIINYAAIAYKGVIPVSRYHEPYIPPREELQREVADGVDFWGFEEEGVLIGVMGIQDRGMSL